MMRSGALALERGSEAEAVRALEVFLSRDPQHAPLWHLLAALHRSLGDLEPAVAALAKAAALAPSDSKIALANAVICLEAGLPSTALFERALVLAGKDRSILLQLAAAHAAEGEVDKSIELLERELLLSPDWLEGHRALARTRWIAGDRESFCGSFERALAASPADAALWRAYIEMNLNDGACERALAIIERARSAGGANPSFDAAEAIVRSELFDIDRAGTLFSRLSEHLNSVTMIVHYLRFLLRAGRIGEAAKVAEDYAPHDPSSQIWSYLSLAWRLLGDFRWQWLEGDPSFIGVYDLAEKLPELDSLAGRLRSLHLARDRPLDQSLRGGTQTGGQLLTRTEPEIVTLRRVIVEAVETHVARLPPPQPGHPLLVQKRSPIRFSGSWSVRLAGGGRHVHHIHPEGWISSALYVALPAEKDGTGDAGWLTLGEANDLGVDLPPLRTVEPKPGRLVLFPSTMWHGTRPFERGERLTVAFDVSRPRQS